MACRDECANAISMVVDGEGRCSPLPPDVQARLTAEIALEHLTEQARREEEMVRWVASQEGGAAGDEAKAQAAATPVRHVPRRRFPVRSLIDALRRARGERDEEVIAAPAAAPTPTEESAQAAPSAPKDDVETMQGAMAIEAQVEALEVQAETEAETRSEAAHSDAQSADATSTDMQYHAQLLSELSSDGLDFMDGKGGVIVTDSEGQVTLHYVRTQDVSTWIQAVAVRAPADDNAEADLWVQVGREGEPPVSYLHRVPVKVALSVVALATVGHGENAAEKVFLYAAFPSAVEDGYVRMTEEDYHHSEVLLWLRDVADYMHLHEGEVRPSIGAYYNAIVKPNYPSILSADGELWLGITRHPQIQVRGS